MASDASSPQADHQDADIIVVGGGMAGLTAAARTVRHGGRAIVVEKNDVVGGNGRFAGYIWTAPSVEVMQEWNPEGDPTLSKTVVEGFAPACEWMESVGVTLAPPQKQLAFGVGRQFDTNHYIDLCRAEILTNGEVLLQTDTTELIMDGDAVVGVRTQAADGTVRDLRAPAVVLATGGFQGNNDLVGELIGEHARAMPLRSSPVSQGDGRRLALQAGAATGTENAGFYGHLIPSGIPFADTSDFVDLSLYYSEHGLLFNLNAERFCDETLADHLTTMELLDQPEGRGLLIVDERVHRDYVIKPYVKGAPSTDKFAITHKRGGRCGVANSIEELRDLPEEWGYDGNKIADAVVAFNEAAAAKSEISPARELDFEPLAEAPYYLIETIPAITFGFHGVLINEHGSVLRPDGSTIKGLYAAGSDAGGLYHRAYAGSLAPAVIFGLAAADHARTA
jgi:succinate dehydrogenase/fumarate reductase flavoprotein subunit